MNSKEQIIELLACDQMINKSMAKSKYGIDDNEFNEIIEDISKQMQVHRIYNRAGGVDYWS